MGSFLITGCPRSGTGYMSKLLKASGVNCGHEGKDKSAAQSDWRRAGEAHPVKLHQTRNPVDCIASMSTVGWGGWTSLIAREAGMSTPSAPSLSWLCEFWLAWNTIASRGSALRYQVEALVSPGHVPDLVAGTIGHAGMEWKFSVPTNYNTRPHDAVTWGQILGLGDVGARVAVMAEHYGYDVR